MKITNVLTQNHIYIHRPKNAQNKPANHQPQIAFGKSLGMPLDTYLIRMISYKTDWEWAQKMNRVTEMIATMMGKKFDISNIIFAAENCIHDINAKASEYSQAFGVKKRGFGSCFTIVNKPTERGFEYFRKYHEYFKDKYENLMHITKSNAQYPEAKTCLISVSGKNQSITILLGKNNPVHIESNIELVKKAYNLLKEKEKPTQQEIINTAATIQWLIAQETPYFRGSDSIANLLSRSLMYSHEIPLSPLKKGISCDFEAFYQNLDNYIKAYPTLFEKNPLTN